MKQIADQIFSSVLWLTSKCNSLLKKKNLGWALGSVHQLLIGCWDVGMAFKSGGRWMWACRVLQLFVNAFLQLWLKKKVSCYLWVLISKIWLSRHTYTHLIPQEYLCCVKSSNSALKISWDVSSNKIGSCNYIMMWVQLILVRNNRLGGQFHISFI